MPRIKEYTSQVGASGPAQFQTARGEDFGAASAQGLNTLGQGIGQVADAVQKHEASLEISDLNAKIAVNGAKWTEEFQNRLKTAQPGDKMFVEQFNADYQKSMDEISEGISTAQGRSHFEQMRASQTGHFLQSAIAGQAELVKEKALLDRQVKFQGFVNMVEKDPSSLPHVLEMMKAQDVVDAGSIGQDNVLRLNQKQLPLLHQAQALAEIRRNPVEAKKKLLEGGYGDLVDVQQLSDEADRYKKAQDADAREKARYDDWARSKAMDKTTTDYMLRVHGEGNPLTRKEVLEADNGLDYTHREYILSKMDAIQNAPPKANASLWNTVYRDISEGKITTQRQLEDYMDRIPYQGGRGYNLQNLMKHLQGSLTPEGQASLKADNEFMKLVESKVKGKNTGIPDPKAEDIIAELRISYLQEKERMKAEGKDPANLRNRASGADYFLNKVPERGGQDKIADIAASYGAKAPGTEPTEYVPLNAPPPGLNADMKRYNEVVKQMGGSRSEMFGPKGEYPTKVNTKAAAEAERLGSLRRGTQNIEQDFARAALTEEEKRRQSEQAKEIEEQNKALKLLGLPPKPVPGIVFFDDNARRPGESIPAWKERTKGSK